jgi:hypothetical protein
MSERPARSCIAEGTRWRGNHEGSLGSQDHKVHNRVFLDIASRIASFGRPGDFLHMHGYVGNSLDTAMLARFIIETSSEDWTSGTVRAGRS